MSEHDSLHPDAGEYWKRNARPDHYKLNAVLQWRECMAQGRPIPEFLWKEVAPLFGFDATKQPDALKPRAPFTPEQKAEMDARIAQLEQLARENGTIKAPEKPMRKPAVIPGTE